MLNKEQRTSLLGKSKIIQGLALLALGIGLANGFENSASAAMPRYGMAGCGIGGAIFSDDPFRNEKWKQIVASIINNYFFGTQTFAITSGTSYCDTPGYGKDSASFFIDLNREKLAKESARGEGETLDALAQVVGCSDTHAFSQKMQANYGALFSNEKLSKEALTAQIRNLSKECVLSQGGAA